MEAAGKAERNDDRRVAVAQDIAEGIVFDPFDDTAAAVDHQAQ